MHDPQTLLDPATRAVERLQRRRYSLDLESLSKLVSSRVGAIGRRDALRTELNARTREMSRAGQSPEGVTAVRDLKVRIREAEAEQRTADGVLNDVMLSIPNLPLDDVPDGGPEDPPVEVRRWGPLPTLTSPHVIMSSWPPRRASWTCIAPASFPALVSLSSAVPERHWNAH